MRLDAAGGFRRDRHLVFGGQCAHDIDVSTNGLGLDRLGLDRPGLVFSGRCLGLVAPLEQPGDATAIKAAKARKEYRA